MDIVGIHLLQFNQHIEVYNRLPHNEKVFGRLFSLLLLFQAVDALPRKCEERLSSIARNRHPVP